MPNYRRARIPGATCFFTVALADRRRSLLVERVDLLRTAFVKTHFARPFDLLAICILPDHLHCVWRLPDGDADNAIRWSQIKGVFSRMLPPLEARSRVRLSKRERGIWQQRYWERVLVNDRDVQAHVDYVHVNPVKHGHASRATEWPYSSIHRAVRRGEVAADWGAGA